MQVAHRSHQPLEMHERRDISRAVWDRMTELFSETFGLPEWKIRKDPDLGTALLQWSLTYEGSKAYNALAWHYRRNPHLIPGRDFRNYQPRADNPNDGEEFV